MFAMTKAMRREKRRGALVFLAALFILGGAIFAFFPIAGVWTADNELLPFSSFNVYFGGAVTIPAKDGSYYLHFQANIPLIVMIQLMALSIISAMLGRNMPNQLLIGILLLLGAIIMEALCLVFIAVVNKGIPVTGLNYAPGFYLSMFCLGVGLFIMIGEYIASRVYWAKRHALV